jgi:hypothetical protein
MLCRFPITRPRGFEKDRFSPPKPRGRRHSWWKKSIFFQNALSGSRAPERLELAVVHDSGNKVGRIARLRSWFPASQVVVFGHSHIPLHEQDEGSYIFNTGSPTDKRRQPYRAMGIIEINKGELHALRHVVVDQTLLTDQTFMFQLSGFSRERQCE